MNAEQRETLDKLNTNKPSIEAVLEELNLGGKPGDLFFRFYYPLCFRYTAEFFNDPSEAENATLPLFEHWMAAAERYDQEKAKMVTYFDRVAKNFCLNYQRDTSYGPELVFQSEELELDDDEDDDSTASTVAFTEEYPTNGVDSNDPETLYLRKEEEEEKMAEARNIRDKLYPGDQMVFDLLLEDYNSDDIASILERTTVSVENAIRRIRATLP